MLKSASECFPAHTPQSRLAAAASAGWTDINEEDMTGIPPLGPRVHRPLPVPGMESSKGPHTHCSKCWQEGDVYASGFCEKCLGTMIVCMPIFCGSS